MIDLKALETSIAEDLRASGLVDWRGLTSRAMQDVKLQIRNQKAYGLKCNHHTDKEIAQAIGVGIRHVQKIIKEQIMLRRANGVRE